MTFDSLEFAVFFAAVFALHWALPRRAGAQNALLLAASWLFFFTWSPKLLGLFLASTALNYAVSRLAAPDAGRPEAQRRVWLGVGIGGDAGLLLLLKYQGFFAHSLNDLFAALGLPVSLPILHLALMVGISFWTLQLVGYLIDVFYGRIAPTRSPLAFALFVAFFPQLLAGPIARGRQLLPQLEAPRTLGADALRRGAALFLLGFFKKFFVADYFGRALVNPVFGDPAGYDAVSHWLALVGFAVQVFCDFSGYSEMAMGLARGFGLELPLNFNFPFLSKNVMELWRRWHITLNTWLFDYLYGPLTTGRGFLRGRLDLGFLVVFLVSGLWHGATWAFVAWGALQGLALVVHRRYDAFYRGLCRKDRRWVATRKRPAYQVAAWALTIGFFVATLVPFRAPTLAASAEFVRGLLGRGGDATVLVGGITEAFEVLLGFGFVIVDHALAADAFRPLRDGLVRLPAPVRGVVYGLALVLLLLFMPVGAGTFIYATF